MMKLIILVLSALASTSYGAPHQLCRTETQDVGTIIGKGSSNEDAFESAVTQCFEKRMQRWDSRRTSAQVSESARFDAGESIILSCAELKCET